MEKISSPLKDAEDDMYTTCPYCNQNLPLSSFQVHMKSHKILERKESSDFEKVKKTEDSEDYITENIIEKLGKMKIEEEEYSMRWKKIEKKLTKKGLISRIKGLFKSEEKLKTTINFKEATTTEGKIKFTDIDPEKYDENLSKIIPVIEKLESEIKIPVDIIFYDSTTNIPQQAAFGWQRNEDEKIVGQLQMSKDCLNILNPEELIFKIAHEFGHFYTSPSDRTWERMRKNLHGKNRDLAGLVREHIADLFIIEKLPHIIGISKNELINDYLKWRDKYNEDNPLQRDYVISREIIRRKFNRGIKETKYENYLKEIQEICPTLPTKNKFIKIINKLKESSEKKTQDEKIFPLSTIGEKTVETPKTPKETLSKVIQTLKEQAPEEEAILREEEIRLAKQESLQQLANKLCFQLADFWGIPRPKISVPRVQIVNIKDWEGFEKRVPIAAYTGPMSYLGIELILINEDYFSQEFQSGLLNIKSAMAEEVCHFLENFVKEQEGIKKISYVTEFFGMISRLYISEQVPELFRGSYRELLHRAINFSKEKKLVEDKIGKLKQQIESFDQIKEKQLGIDIEKIKKQTLDDYELALDAAHHLAYYPAAAYYFEIKKLTPAERYNLLRSNPKVILNYIIRPDQVKLEEIRKKIIEREQLKIAVEEALKEYPESAKFFERQAKEATFQGWGRGQELVRFYRGLSGISEDKAVALLNSGMKSSGLLNFGNALREKYRQKVGLDIADHSKGNIKRLLDAHRDATPSIEGKPGAYLMSITTNRKFVERYKFIFTIVVPKERVAESEDQINENTLLVRDRDFIKSGEYEYTTTKPFLLPCYIASVENTKTGKIYINSELGNEAIEKEIIHKEAGHEEYEGEEVKLEEEMQFEEPEIEETQEYVPPEETEEYAPEQIEKQEKPQEIVISIEGQLSKKEAKKLKELEIDIPKKLAEKLKKKS